MSFYGNVTYYLSNAFNKVIYRNAGSASGNNASIDSKASPGIPAYEYGLMPRNRKDETILETGNKWIVFADPDGTVQNNQIKIFHQTVNANTNDVSISPTIVSLAEENPPTALNFGAVLSLPTITYDNAGHIVSSGAISYQLPTPQGETDLNKIKWRLSTLEEILTGDHDTYIGDGSDAIQESGNPYATQINTLLNKVDPWEMGSGNSRLEPNSIGTTLRDLLVRIGIRARVGDDYLIVDETGSNVTYPDGSILAELTRAGTYGYNAQLLAKQVRTKLNEVIRAINQLHPTANLSQLDE